MNMLSGYLKNGYDRELISSVLELLARLVGYTAILDDYYEHLGVTSIIRELEVNPNWYETMLHFFRSDAWKLNSLGGYNFPFHG